MRLVKYRCALKSNRAGDDPGPPDFFLRRGVALLRPAQTLGETSPIL